MTDLQLPAHLLNRANRGIAAQLAISLPSGTIPYLSIKGGRFTLFDAAGNERQVGFMDDKLGLCLDICVVDSNPHVSKIYYAKAYDPNSDTTLPPDCWSDNGIGPSAQAAAPQHRDCKTCPHNQWGSGVSRLTGKSTKECNDVQKIAIVVPGFSEAVFLLRVPPASLKHLGKYIQELQSFSAGGRKVDICDLTTRVYFHKDAVGVLGFTAAGWVDAATAAVADKAYESKAADALVGKNDRPYTGEVGVPPAARTSEVQALPPPIPMQVNPQPAFQSAESIIAHGGTPGTSQEPKRPRGRPRKEPMQEAPASQAPFLASPSPIGPSSPATPTNGSTEIEEVPDFLKRIESAPGMPPASQPTPKPAGPSFGMQAAAPAPDDMQARIAAVLAMKTGG